MSEQSDTGFNDMPMFALSNSVLLWGVWARDTMKDAFAVKILRGVGTRLPNLTAQHGF
jgi:hypothetical protein